VAVKCDRLFGTLTVSPRTSR